MPSSLLLLTFDVIVGLAQIFLGLLAENAGEWVFHRYVLHELGKRPNSLWSYHWSEHHRIARANKMFDPGYTEWPLRSNTQGKEVLFLVAVVIVHLPLMAILPLSVAGLYAGLILYYLRHRRSHVDPEWAETYPPWHHEHHLSPTVDANWCVTRPWFAWLMGTRIRSDRTGTSRSWRNRATDNQTNGLTGSDDLFDECGLRSARGSIPSCFQIEHGATELDDAEMAVHRHPFIRAEQFHCPSDTTNTGNPQWACDESTVNQHPPRRPVIAVAIGTTWFIRGWIASQNSTQKLCSTWRAKPGLGYKRDHNRPREQRRRR